MLWIHSSFSSGVGAEMRYTMWLPSTTLPSASVLHALISCPRLLGMYNSKQFCWDQTVAARTTDVSGGGGRSTPTHRFPRVLHLTDAQVLQGNDAARLLVLLATHVRDS